MIEQENSASLSPSYGKFTIPEEQITHDITVIMPAFNEEKRITPVLDDIIRAINEKNLAWNIIVAVDGGDSTSDIVGAYAEKYDFVEISRESGRSGKGHAVKRALTKADGDFTLLMDADNSVSITEIMDKVPLCKEADVVILSRYGGSNDFPFIRRIISRGFNFLLHIFLKLDINDTQSGYKIINTKQFKEAMNKVSVTNTFFDVALLYYLQKSGSHIIETDVSYRHNDGSTFHPIGEVIGQGVSLLAFIIRRSKFYEKIPKSLVDLYYRKFRWI